METEERHNPRGVKMEKSKQFQRKMNKLQSRISRLENEKNSLKKQLMQEKMKKSREEKDLHLQQRSN